MRCEPDKIRKKKYFKKLNITYKCPHSYIYMHAEFYEAQKYQLAESENFFNFNFNVPIIAQRYINI